MQQLALRLLDDWHGELPRFARDVATSDLTWGAVQRFGARNNQMLRRDNEVMDRFIAKLPPADRATVEKALKQTFGR
jgi:hypothetical protein